MEGFISYVTGEYRTEGGSKTPSCLVLWFPDWILDTQGKGVAVCKTYHKHSVSFSLLVQLCDFHSFASIIYTLFKTTHNFKPHTTFRQVRGCLYGSVPVGHLHRVFVTSATPRAHTREDTACAAADLQHVLPLCSAAHVRLLLHAHRHGLSGKFYLNGLTLPFLLFFDFFNPFCCFLYYRWSCLYAWWWVLALATLCSTSNPLCPAALMMGRMPPTRTKTRALTAAPVAKRRKKSWTLAVSTWPWRMTVNTF